MWAGPTWLPLGGDHPFEAEAELGPLELGEVVDPADERPAWIVGLTDVEAMPIAHGDARRGAHRPRQRARARAAAGSGTSRIAPDAEGAPPHCHTAEEELFVVLEGDGTLRLGDDQEHPVRTGSIVARPAGTGVAHSFRAGEQGLTLLAYGQRDPRDVVFFPRSSTLRVPGLGGLTFRVEPVDPRERLSRDRERARPQAALRHRQGRRRQVDGGGGARRAGRRARQARGRRARSTARTDVGARRHRRAAPTTSRSTRRTRMEEYLVDQLPRALAELLVVEPRVRLPGRGHARACASC